MTAIYIAIICVFCVAAATLFVLFSNNCIQISRQEITTSGIEEDIKIVHLSDLHGKSFGKDNARLIKKVAAQSPSFIAVTGDIIHKYRERDIKVALKTLERLVEIAPVLYVSGNHEMRSTKYRNFKNQIERTGATVLDDAATFICGVSVAGVNCAHIKSGKYFGLAEGDSGYKILLAHFPHYIDRYSLAGYDLTLCGHAHGGQWRVPFTKIGIFAPGQGLFPKYACGIHSCGDMRQVISRGLGNSQCPLRLFNRPEIVVITLKSERDKR